MSTNFITPNTKPKQVILSNYQVLRDAKSYGFKNVLNWEHSDPLVVGFKIYRVKYFKSLLKKKYTITQAALEKLTPIKSHITRNNILYNKSLFVTNDNVQFADSGSNKFIQKPEDYKTTDYQEYGFIAKTKDGKYSFVDKNIKFGESYSYFVTAVSLFAYESEPSRPVVVNVEDVESPGAPTEINFEVSAKGILLNFAANKDDDIEFFDLYKRKFDEKDFKKVVRLPATKQAVYYLDREVIPGVDYYYKVYGVDFYDNVSLSAKKLKGYFEDGFRRKKDIPFPEFNLEIKENTAVITGIKNDERIAGYKIERRDDWRYEKGFSSKTYNDVPWPALNTFNSSGSFVFTDYTTREGRIYSYRITSIAKNGIGSSFSVTPPLAVSGGVAFGNIKAKPMPDTSVKFKSFSVQSVDTMQKPIYALVNWKIQGNWSYLILESENVSIQIDDIHTNAYIMLEKGKKYNFTVKLFDSNEIESDRLTGISVTT